MTPSSSFIFSIAVPRRVEWKDGELSKRTAKRTVTRTLEREDFYAHLWEVFTGELIGVHEGTLLAADVPVGQDGSPTKNPSWTLDSAEAPRARDWVDSQAQEFAVLYFSSRESAEKARLQIFQATELPCGPVEEQVPQDWDAEWKASFQGVPVPPFWEILPPWRESPDDPRSRVIRINPGAGFGTGTHETTQLCLQAIAGILPGARGSGSRVLDFGSGSGILAIGAALLGAQVDGVEIDSMAVDNARENLALNPTAVDSVCFVSTLEQLGTSPEKYSVVIANILKPVLLEFADRLVSRLEPSGRVVLSGLLDEDLREVIPAYSARLGGKKPEVLARAEWRALVF